jgi:hypothetical protein
MPNLTGDLPSLTSGGIRKPQKDPECLRSCATRWGVISAFCGRLEDADLISDCRALAVLGKAACENDCPVSIRDAVLEVLDKFK